MPLHPNRCKIGFAAFLLAGTLNGCGSLSPQTVAAHKISDALPQILGPAAHYEVRVQGDTMALTRGRARNVHVEGRDVQLSPTITVDTLTFDAQDVSFDTKAKKLQKVGPVAFVGTMDQTHLESYLGKVKLSKILQGLRVKLRARDVQAQVPVNAGPIHTAVTVYGNPAPNGQDARTINFVVDKARLGFLPVPAVLFNQALKEVNPIVDLSAVRVPIKVQSTSVEGGKLVLRGTAKIEPTPESN